MKMLILILSELRGKIINQIHINSTWNKQTRAIYFINLCINHLSFLIVRKWWEIEKMAFIF